jgi:hypothetical protein
MDSVLSAGTYNLVTESGGAVENGEGVRVDVLEAA